MIQEYLSFQEEIRELLRLKEKYMYQILENVYRIERFIFGWIEENGRRAEKWAELYVVVTNILDLINAVIKILVEYNSPSCTGCNIERYNLHYWIWWLVSFIIPDIPVIDFPEWPDFELDLSLINFQIVIPYVDFDLTYYPVDLPDIPRVNISADIPGIGRLPEPPELPEFPDIPIIDLPELPNLPDAPRIPNFMAKFAFLIDILDIITRIMCLLRKIPLAPEWEVGTRIAIKTERMGYIPSIDFLDQELPIISFDWIDLIRVNVHNSLIVDTTNIVEVLVDEMKSAISDVSQSLNIDRRLPSQYEIDINEEL